MKNKKGQNGQVYKNLNMNLPAEYYILQHGT